jgi:hypothetical protein
LEVGLLLIRGEDKCVWSGATLEKEIPFQSKLNSNLSNLCTDYQYDKRK